VRILAGTDAGVPGTAHGASLHHELELLTQCGLTATQALAAATAVPAAWFGLSDRGRVAPGRQADLVLVRGDPTTDITHTRSILAVWRRGQRIDRGGKPEGNPDRDKG
jgi:imidazolonepropionase-like amidohydrolase